MALLLVASSTVALAADDTAKYAVWITGDPIMQDGKLMFRADKPVQGNTTGNVVLLGATKQTINFLAAAYMKAAEKHMTLRLYGVLVPIPDAKDPKAPSVEFITWKLHLPSDPDELPAGSKIILGPESRVPGYTVEKTPPPK
jgi:hypothetical protein